jgi:hypothetical protein
VYTSARGIRGFDPGPGNTWTIVRQPGCFLGGTNLNRVGTMLVYDAVCTDPARDGVYTVRLDGTRRRQVFVGDVGPVSWSPDGRWIAFAENNRNSTFRGDESYAVLERSRAMFVMRADGTDVGRVTPTGYNTAAWVPPTSSLDGPATGSASTTSTTSTPAGQLG